VLIGGGCGGLIIIIIIIMRVAAGAVVCVNNSHARVDTFWFEAVDRLLSSALHTTNSVGIETTHTRDGMASVQMLSTRFTHEGE
jgi:hypothetical protein